MAQIIPFRGVRYNREKVGTARDVVAPPYDVIDAEAQKALYARHPHNVIRLELGVEEPGDGPTHNRYTRAARHLQDWLSSGVLQPEPRPAIYLYAIEYTIPGRSTTSGPRVLKGFLSLMVLEDFASGRVLPHENTRAAAKTDRLNLLETCQANFSPIVSLFSDPDGRVSLLIEKASSCEPPSIDFVDDDGFRQQLWVITDPNVHEELAAAMRSKSLFIADGHHRYETALAYRNKRREQEPAQPSHTPRPWEAVLMLCASLNDPGLTVLPTHRVLTRPVPPIDEIRAQLEGQFSLEEIPFEPGGEAAARERFIHALRERGATGYAFGLALKGMPSYVLLTLRPGVQPAEGDSPRGRLDVSVLHRHILRPLALHELTEQTVTYTKDDEEALDWVQSGKAEAAFLLNPTKVSEVSAVASAGERMPHKSTYFFPKPLTGLVMHVMEGDHREGSDPRR